MKIRRPLLLTVALICLTCSVACAQFTIDWYKVAGGGGTSTNGAFSVSGSIGQPDAGGALTGGYFALTGGFWSLYAVQTPGCPTLYIRLVAPHSAVVAWLNQGGYNLQTNDDLTTANWNNYGGTILLNNGTNSVNITPPVGNLYFRLH